MSRLQVRPPPGYTCKTPKIHVKLIETNVFSRLKFPLSCCIFCLDIGADLHETLLKQTSDELHRAVKEAIARTKKEEEDKYSIVSQHIDFVIQLNGVINEIIRTIKILLIRLTPLRVVNTVTVMLSLEESCSLFQSNIFQSLFTPWQNEG